MKKFTRIFCILMCAAAAVLSLVGCADAGEPEYKIADPSTFAVSVESVEQKLDGFMQGRDDRTSFTDAEEEAAEYLRDTLVGYGYADLPASEPEGGEGESDGDNGKEPVGMIREFTVNIGSLVLKSRNVVAVYGDAEKSDRNVIIGAHYDNFYRTPYADSKRKGEGSPGALLNGTGVAALLGIAEYLQVQKPSLDFTVTLVFFGASSRYNYGVTEFYENMSAREKTGTMLMIELQRLGVDHVYAFSDARETKRQPFFEDVARRNGLDIYKVTQKSPVITEATALGGVPYYQWAMTGNFGVFFNHNIPTLNLIGANWETLDLTDRESKDRADVCYTEKDTLSNLKADHRDYGFKIAAAATLVVKSLEDGAFVKTMEYDREHFPDTDVLTKNWIWYLVVLGIAIVAGGVMTLVSSRLAKKYPIIPPQPPKMKMAVFGMDYEDKNSADIFVDIKSPEPSEDIFPGVPNNDGASHNDPFGGIFPPSTAQPEKRDEANAQAFEQPAAESEQEKKSEEQSAQPDEPVAQEQSEKPEEPTAQPEEPEQERNPEEPAQPDGVEKQAEKKPAQKKRTSTGAGESSKTKAAGTAPKKRAPAQKKPLKTDNADDKVDG